MFQTQDRRRRSLRLLRAGHVRRVCDIPERAANDLLGGLLGGADAKRSGDAIHPAKKRAKPEGQRVLLLPVRRIIRSDGGAGEIYVAVTIPDFFHRRLRHRPDRSRRLVHRHLAKTELIRRTGILPVSIFISAVT